MKKLLIALALFGLFVGVSFSSDDGIPEESDQEPTAGAGDGESLSYAMKTTGDLGNKATVRSVVPIKACRPIGPSLATKPCPHVLKRCSDRYCSFLVKYFYLVCPRVRLAFPKPFSYYAKECHPKDGKACGSPNCRCKTIFCPRKFIWWVKIGNQWVGLKAYFWVPCCRCREYLSIGPIYDSNGK